jgi:hypothetical protein
MSPRDGLPKGKLTKAAVTSADGAVVDGAIPADGRSRTPSLRALGTAITPEIAPHLQGLMRKDSEHFADAVRAQGLDHPEELRRRALAGADGLVEAVTLATAPGHPA